MKYFFLILFVLFFVSCSSHVAKVAQKDEKTKITDLVNIPQNVDFFTNRITSNEEIYEIQKNYEKKYFNVWNSEKPRDSLEEIEWPFRSYKVGNSYGENFQLLKQSFFDEMYEKANFDEYASINANAITLHPVNLRAFPTSKPLLKNPNIAGEGFPFDYMQNSSIHANKPLFVSHYSKDKAWAYVFSSFASGWIKSSDFVFLDRKYTDIWQKAEQIFLIKEGIPLYGKNEKFLFYSKIGMMLALISEDEKYFTVLAISKYKNSKPMYEKIKIPKTIATKKILILNKEALEKIMSELFKSNYGWGGIYEQRDCSSTLRDMFAPFGIWLPRNSSQQAKIGKVINLENLSDEEKIIMIKTKAIPFQTLLYKKGHIVLYVGTLDGEIIIFHNVWGVKTIKDNVEGRVVIGKTIFSTLKLGKDLKDYDEESGILRNIKSMNILTQ